MFIFRNLEPVLHLISDMQKFCLSFLHKHRYLLSRVSSLSVSMFVTCQSLDITDFPLDTRTFTQHLLYSEAPCGQLIA